MATTTYDIRVKYMLDDKASKGVGMIGREARKSAKQTSRLDKTIRRLALGAAGFMTFRLGKKLLVDFNSSLQQAKIQMQGLMQMNMGGTWARNQKRANFLVRRFQKDAAKSVGTTKDFVTMGGMIAGPMSQAGASVEQIAAATKGAVIAGKAFGLQSEQTAKDIRSAVFGRVNQKDMLMVQLLGATGTTLKEWNDMARKAPEEAVNRLNKLLGSPAINKMAEEQGKSWEGITSTLEDNLQRTLGKIGLPLMQAMGAEMEKLTKWFEENPEKVNEIAKSIGDGIVTAFKMVKGVFGFIIRHKRLLMMIAAAVIAQKAIGGLAAGLGRLAGLGKLAGGAAEAGKGLTGVASKLGTFASKLGVAVGALSAMAIGASAVADWVLDRQEKRIQKETDVPLLAEQARALGGSSIGGGTGIQRNTLMGAAGRARHLGLKGDFGASGAVANRKGELQIGEIAQRNKALAAGKFTAADKAMAVSVVREAEKSGFTRKGIPQLGKIRGKFGVGDDMKSRMIMGIAQKSAGGAGKFSQMTPGEMADRLMAANKDANDGEVNRMTEFLRGLDRALLLDRRDKGGMWGAIAMDIADAMAKPLTSADGQDVGKDKASAKGRRTTNVKINKIEIVSDDPARFAFNLVGAFEDHNKSPVQAKRTISEGR